MAYNYNSPYGMGMQYPQTSIPVNNYPQPSYQPANTNLMAKTINYASEEEIRGLILPPNVQVMAIDREKPNFYIKSSDSLGRSTVDIFEFKKVDESNKELNNVNYLTKDDLKDFVSKDEFNSFMKKCEDLTRLLNNKKGGNRNEQPDN